MIVLRNSLIITYRKDEISLLTLYFNVCCFQDGYDHITSKSAPSDITTSSEFENVLAADIVLKDNDKELVCVRVCLMRTVGNEESMSFFWKWWGGTGTFCLF